MSLGPPRAREAALTALVLASGVCFAQESADEAIATLQLLPALTPVDLIFDQAVSSNEQVNGDRFLLHVAEDVVVDGVVVIPAGSRGEGEVVHAARSRAGGKAGELILAARYVRVGGREIKLRSFAGGSGRDRTKASLGIAVTLGFPALLVRGGAYVIPEGTLANAKTAEALELPAAPESSAPPSTEEP